MELARRVKEKRPRRKRNFGQWFEDIGSTYVMILPTFIMFIILTLYPMFWVFRFMFYEYDGVSKAVFVGFDNFVRMFTRDQAWWSSVLITFKVAFLKLIIEIPLAMLTAVLLNKKEIKGKGLFRGIYFLPTVTSAAVMSVVFSFVLSPYNGILNSLLLKFGIIHESVDFLSNGTSALVTCAVISVWQIFGQNTLLILSGLQGIPEDVYESAQVDGANRLQCFLKITVPLIMPTLRIILMLAIIGSLGIFDTIFVLTGGGPSGETSVMAIHIYQRLFGEGVPEYGYSACLSFISSVISGIITVFYLAVSKKSADVY
ncbi:MAG: sugar ABC transporter permease [Clostridia bacterium]|nr:sugar ABC transporter permease [Clostridia bacterium]